MHFLPVLAVLWLAIAAVHAAIILAILPLERGKVPTQWGEHTLLKVILASVFWPLIWLLGAVFAAAADGY